MSGFKVEFSVLNQLATPALHAAPLAQRPAAGQPGRVFIDTDNPSSGMYRDTGSVWVQIAQTASTDTDTLQIVTTRGNTTTQNITVGAATVPAATVDVRKATNPLNNADNWALTAVSTPTIPSGASFGTRYVNAAYGALSQTFSGNATIGNGGLNSAGNFINTLGSNASGTITVTQGTTIRAISGTHSGVYFNTANAMTYSHVAGLRILQPINSGAAAATVTNYYGLQISDSTAGSGSITYTNRWGIYQEGASDTNYMAAPLLIGTTTASGNALRIVNGTTSLSGAANTVPLSIIGSNTGTNGSTCVAISQSWNTSGSPTALSIIVTNTTSGSNANLVNFQSSGNSFRVDKNAKTIINTNNDGILLSGTLSGSTASYKGISIEKTINTTVNDQFSISVENDIQDTFIGNYYGIKIGDAAVLDNNSIYSGIQIYPFVDVLSGSFCSGIDINMSGVVPVDPYQTTALQVSSSIGGYSLYQTGTDKNYFAAAIGIKTSLTDDAALLQIDSTDQGFLLPRMTSAEAQAITAPPNGLMVYSTTVNAPAFYDGTGWRKVSHSAL